MKDLTQGSIPGHLAGMAVPIAVGMLMQALYYLVDLYFVAQLGGAALAGVSAAGNVMFIVLALTQMLGVSTASLISHAVGRKDRKEANHIFNQSVALAGLCLLATILGGYMLAGAYMGLLSADAAAREAGATFLYWYIPGLGLQFASVAMGSALRGTGIVRPTMIVQSLTVVLNAILAPVFIAGWGTGYAMGVAGAGFASTVAIAVGNVVLAAYFLRLERYVGFDPAQWRPRLATWARLLGIGLPAGGEFALIAVYNGFIYWLLRDFGAAAQAGFGLGGRIMQSIFLPAMAIAFAAAPIAGQNFGARHWGRVRETFRAAATGSCAVMLLVTALIQWQGGAMVRAFTTDPGVIAVAVEMLEYVSWNFFALGLVFTSSSLFQALGNTWPGLASTGTRLVTFAMPALWLSSQPGFQLRHVWYLSVATVLLQALVSLWLLRGEFRRRLGS